MGYLHCIDQEPDFYSSKYNDFIALDDFNSKIVNNFIESTADKFILKLSQKSLHALKLLIILIYLILTNLSK